jgi:hypothetical protein
LRRFNGDLARPGQESDLQTVVVHANDAWPEDMLNAD